MKKIIAIILMMISCFVLCSCSGGDNSTIKETDKGVAEEKATKEEQASEKEENSTIEPEKINVGDTLSTDFVEMTFNEVNVGDDIKYSVTSGNVTRITGPDPVSGEQYICMTGTIKNISQSPLPVYDFFVGELDLDGYKYTLTANDCDILDGNGSTFTEIDPLMEYTFRIYTAVPESLATSYSSGTFHFGFYDVFDNAELARNMAFEKEPVKLCPYQYILEIK